MDYIIYVYGFKCAPRPYTLDYMVRKLLESAWANLFALACVPLQKYKGECHTFFFVNVDWN